MPSQQERVRKCLSMLLVRLPFYGALALRLEHRVLSSKDAVSMQIFTAATDGKRIFYRAQFLQNLSDADLVFLIAHETLHAALSHPLRGADKEDVHAWNIAADDTVNRLLEPDFERLPEFAVTVKPDVFGLTETQWERMSTEAKYLFLAKERKGKSGAIVKQEEKEAEGGCDFLPMSHDAPTPEQWQQWIKEATDFAESARGHGTVPAWVDELVLASGKAKVPWQKVLHQFVQQRVISHWNYPPSRRYQAVALLPKPQRERYGILGVAIDTSGSITSEQLEQFWREVLAIRKDYPRLTIRLVTCDAEVTSDEIFPPFVPLPEAKELKGRGGTDFRPAFERFKQPPVPEAVVYLTDGMGDYPTAPPPYPVLWILSRPEPHWREHLPFGSAILLEGSNWDDEEL
ncbi:MAG: VWA-like domain-containing protein [Armatimonadetes bacterium]|nr:VWA-like domain-containing protein [Armatimonadota bacterium]MDW8027984.1 VWA-like domain-containing protein [Armatimonadota bacterium]